MRFFKSLHWRIMMILFLLIISIMIIVGTSLIYSVENTYTRQFNQDMQSFSTTLTKSNIIGDNINYEEADYANQLFRTFKIYYQVDDINRKGFLLDSTGAIIYPENTDSPEITTNIMLAMNKQEGLENDNKEFFDYAKPIVVSGEVKYILYLRQNREFIDSIVSSLKTSIIGAVFIILIVTMILSYFISTAITVPIYKLTDSAAKMAEGDFEPIVSLSSGDEISKLTDTFNYMAKEIKKSEDMRMEFLANVSHELKTPLTSIKSYSETLLENEMDRETEKNFMEVINTEAGRMSDLVKDLLELSRFDYKEKVFNKTYFNLDSTIKKAIRKISIEADKKHQKIKYKNIDAIENVFADSTAVEQILLNIISNAIKYTNENGRINITLSQNLDMAQIIVEDNGVGIPSEDLPRIFERFYRVDKARSRQMGGTGLGLSIAKKMVEENDGTIELQSEFGKGTKVIIEFPLNEIQN